jgi:predicted dehydrogenase
MTTPDRKVKIGIAGCGVVATAYYLPYLVRHPNADLVAVCDLYQTRTEACVRLFGAREQYLDYYEMLEKADLDAIWILTAPGTHVPFTLAAVEAGKHVLIQKPMATNMDDARTIASAVHSAGVKALIEPSSNSPLDPVYAHLRDLVRKGVLGQVSWFSLAATGPTRYQPWLGSNPYGKATFFDADSGGFLFDMPYAPSEIVALLGPCKSVMGAAWTAIPEDAIVPEVEYDRFLAQVTDPDKANYWDVVLDLPRSHPVKMLAPDNAYSLYQMAQGGFGTCHVGRTYHPRLPQTGGGSLQIFGTEGNLLMGAGYKASIVSSRKDLLPEVDDDGWYHIPVRTTGPGKWPQPAPGSWNYYHESSRHLIECILEDREPVVDVSWGMHITEMMYGALESHRTGTRYEMTTTLEY